MASARNHLQDLKVAITLILIYSLASQPSKSAELQAFSHTREMQQSKLVLGSRPPGCVNKCRNCKPCSATLVIISSNPVRGFREASRGDDGGYYLLSWKCKCGDKLYKP